MRSRSRTHKPTWSMCAWHPSVLHVGRRLGNILRRSSKLTRQRSLKVIRAWIRDRRVWSRARSGIGDSGTCGEATRPRRSSYQDSVLQLGAPRARPAGPRRDCRRGSCPDPRKSEGRVVVAGIGRTTGGLSDRRRGLGDSIDDCGAVDVPQGALDLSEHIDDGLDLVDGESWYLKLDDANGRSWFHSCAGVAGVRSEGPSMVMV